MPGDNEPKNYPGYLPEGSVPAAPWAHLTRIQYNKMKAEEYKQKQLIKAFEEARKRAAERKLAERKGKADGKAKGASSKKFVSQP